MDIQLIEKILISKNMWYMAKNLLDYDDKLHLCTAINLMQDSVEIFLLAIAFEYDSQIKQNIKFEEYFQEINKKIIPYELPFQAQLIRLNKARTDSKHYCLIPQKTNCEEFLNIINAFYINVVDKLFSIDYESISLLETVIEANLKSYLLAAQDALKNKEYEKCAIECRKVIYEKFENDYNISVLKGEDNDALVSFKRYLCKAPDYAKNNQYIEKNVKDPTDYIVLNTTEIDRSLLKYSIDHNTFWNILRLTPKVYKIDENNWAIKRDYKLIEPENLINNINYIFTSTVEIVLKIQEFKSKIKKSDQRIYEMELKGKDIPIFSKASGKSEIIIVLPETVNKIYVEYSTVGLDNDKKIFFKVFLEIEKNYFEGFVSEANILFKD